MTANPSTNVRASESFHEASGALLAQVSDWARECIAEFADQTPTEGHDQGTFTTGWEPYIRATGDVGPLQFMKDLRDKIAAHFVANGKWKHGYWTMQEAHHGTEHYELFLGCLWRLDPEDPETVRQMVDAAEHMGNWSDDVPAWFDWDRGLYKSMYFGADGVDQKDAAGMNVPDHFRCVNICLLAHRMTNDPRYLDLASLYAGRWADAILAGDELPVGLNDDGGVYVLEGESRDAYLKFAGQSGQLSEHVNRAENLLASGAIGALLETFELTGEDRYRAAAERLLDMLATQLDDPDAGPAAAALMDYRRKTGDWRYDDGILAAAGNLDAATISALSVEPEPQRDSRPSGVGKRQDMPNWSEDGAPRRCNPVLLAAAAEISGDETLAIRAVDLAGAYLSLARECYPAGRHHGCSARTVSAISRGHGRDNNAGVTTAVLSPLMARFGT